MQLQGSYYIQREVFDSPYFIKVHNTFERGKDNTMLVDAALSHSVLQNAPD